MKTAISVPDPVFREAERYARKTGKSRSELYSEAVRCFLLQHSSDSVTQAMDTVCDRLGAQDNGFVRQAARRLLRRESW